MSHKIDAKQINKRLNLYTIDTQKFKTDLIGVYIKRKLSSKEAAYNTLITRILSRGTKKYPSGKILQNKLDASYGMILVSDVVKQGSYHILQFRLQFPNHKHIQEQFIFEEALDLLHEVIFKPLADENGFDPHIFIQEKNNLLDEIRSRENDKMSFALDRCIEHMFEGEGYGQYVYGDEKTVEAIEAHDLYKHYLELLESSLFDICIMGDLKDKSIGQSVEKYFPVKENDYVDYMIRETHEAHFQLKTIKESQAIKEGKLVMGFRTYINHTEPLYEASVLAYHILGGGPSSILFHRLREDESLCYYVYAKSDKYKGALFIGAGIDPNDLEVVTGHVFEVIETLKKEGVSQSTLDDTANAMVDSIHALSDFSNAFMNFLYGELLGKSVDHVVEISEIVQGYKNVSVEDIKAVFDKLKPDLIYLLHGDEDDILQ